MIAELHPNFECGQETRRGFFDAFSDEEKVPCYTAIQGKARPIVDTFVPTFQWAIQVVEGCFPTEQRKGDRERERDDRVGQSDTEAKHYHNDKQRTPNF